MIFFQAALFGGQLVEVCAFFRVQRVHFVQAFQRADHFRQRFFHRLTHGVFEVKLRLLRQVTDLDARLRARFPFDVGIDAGHDAQQGGLTGAVQAQYADFGPRKKLREMFFKI